MQMLVVVAVFVLLHQDHALGSVSEEKCREYAGLVRQRRETEDAESLLGFSFKPVGKEPAAPGEFPYMAHLGYGPESNKAWACGGALISDQHVLTAATCKTFQVVLLHNRRRRELNQDQSRKDESDFPPFDSPVQWVQLGYNSSDAQEFTVESIVTHPNISDVFPYNDIAVLKLATKVQFTQYIRPACLHTTNEDLSNTTVVATGWGSPAFGKPFSTDLMKVALDVYTTEQCDVLKFSEQEFKSDIQLCIGGSNSSRTLCNGDGGAPLQVKNEEYSDMQDVAGIVSFGYMCGLFQMPIFATKVSAYIPWIEAIVWPKL